jgi:hypothetical protein
MPEKTSRRRKPSARYVARRAAPQYTAGAQTAAAPTPTTDTAPTAFASGTEPQLPRMLEALPPRYTETRPPLMYRLIKEAAPTRSTARIAKSWVYRANAFSCTFFYKPISRTLIEWED